MHYYKFNMGDYYKHTSHLSLMEDLAYRKMLDKYYRDEKPFSDDVKKIARRIGMKDFEQEIEDVLDDFFVLVDGLWTHSKADKNLLDYQKNAANSRLNGQSGGRPKKEEENPAETQQVIINNPDETHPAPTSNLNHKPLTNNHKPKTSTIPYQKILDVYHEHASNLPKVEILTDKRKTAIRIFWNKDEKHKDMDFYKRYFSHVNQLNFLIGNVEPSGNRSKPFKADLLFLMNIDNLAKIVENKYAN